MSDDKKVEPERKSTFTGVVQQTSSDDWASGRREIIIKSTRDEKD
jgi:hypothetical protein